MESVQHTEARKLLPFIASATKTHQLLTYGTAAGLIGRDPKTNSRMVAQVCDLLDAAAAYAGVPLLALITVREVSGHINRKAWATDDVPPEYRDSIILKSLRHKFGEEDFLAISDALEKLNGKSNRAAWRFVRETIPAEEFYMRLASTNPIETSDAIDDIGTDVPRRIMASVISYARDPKIREAVQRRADGKCELCGELGFLRVDGTRYLECHHIIALANDGEDRMTNVIALCPNDHREAHFGKRRDELEKDMIRKIRLAG